MLTITNEDNMKLMARYPDKYFDLAIVGHYYLLYFCAVELFVKVYI